MVEAPHPMTDEEAIQAAVSWCKRRYADVGTRAWVADRVDDEVFLQLEMPEEAALMMVHVRRDEHGAIIVDQQDIPSGLM